MLVRLNALLRDGSLLAHGFDALHKELGSDGHESDGDDNGTEANPRIDFGFRLGKLAFLFPEGSWGRWVECESVVLARGVVEEDSRANVAEIVVSVG